MKDRVREVVFDLLGTAVRDTLALDLFAGTGALGFEALSRGAARAIFTERHFPTADALRWSARDLGVVERCEVRPGDVLTWAKRMPELPAADRWLIFISPPWSMFQDRQDDLMSLVATMLAAAPAGSIHVVEGDGSFDPGLLPAATEWEHRPVLPAVLHVHGRLVS